MAKIKVPIPEGGENNLESKFLRAQSVDQEAVKEYREALEGHPKCPLCNSFELEQLRSLSAGMNTTIGLQTRKIAELERECEGLREALTLLHRIALQSDLATDPDDREVIDKAWAALGGGKIHAHCMGTEFPKREK